jgi:hypothetical protein
MEKKEKTSTLWVAGIVMLLFAACGGSNTESNSEFNSNIDRDQTEIDTSYMEIDSSMSDTLMDNRQVPR